MCGRFTLRTPAKDIVELFRLAEIPDSLLPEGTGKTPHSAQVSASARMCASQFDRRDDLSPALRFSTAVYIRSNVTERDHQSGEFQQAYRIGRRFAISTHEITEVHYRRFLRAVNAIRDGDNPKAVLQPNRDDAVVMGMTWYEAAHYCNWLSEQEGIGKKQWCYEPNRQGAYLAGMKAKEKFWELTGYRLPTVAEWAYACRAGTVMTSRDYRRNKLSDNSANGWPGRPELSIRPAPISEPNELGLFGMMGSSCTWCFDLSHGDRKRSGSIIDDQPTTQPVEDGNLRGIRSPALFEVSSLPPNSSAPNLGFRPVRTYP